MLKVQSVDHKRPLFYILQVDCASLEQQIAEQKAWKQEQRRKDEALMNNISTRLRRPFYSNRKLKK